MMKSDTNPAETTRLQQRCESFRLADSYSSHNNDQRLVTELAQASPSVAAHIASRLAGTGLHTRRILNHRQR